MTPELHAFFLDAGASSHPVHAELAPLYRRVSDQAGDRQELIAYSDEFEGLLGDVRDHIRNPGEDLDADYLARLNEFHGELRAIDARRAQACDLQIEIRQRLEEIEDLLAGYGEGLRTDDEPSYEGWRNARGRTLAGVERLRADPDMAPHLDHVLANLDELANAALPPTLAEAARAAGLPPAPTPGETASSAPVPNTAAQPEPNAAAGASDSDMPPPVWAGIGSRRTPASVLTGMTELAGRMADAGWHLSSGGAEGADTAFAAGTPADRRTVWLPWPGYNDLSGPDCPTLPPDRLQQCLAIVEPLHPAWDRCSDSTRKLHARNVAILLGPTLDRPADAVVCWTEGGALSGGAGMALRIAAEHGIPVLNLGSMTMEAVWERLQDMRRSRSAAPRSSVEPADAAPLVGSDRKEGLARVLPLRNAPPDAIRIDRQTRWGNPFIIGRDGTREEVISKYRDHLWNGIRDGKIPLDELAALHGKDLACHCAPQPCHGDVLVRAASWASTNRSRTEARTAGAESGRQPNPPTGSSQAAQPDERSYDAATARDAPLSPKAVVRASTADTVDTKLPASLGLVTNHKRLLEAARDGWFRPPEGKAFLLAGDGSVSEEPAAGQHPIPVRLAFDPAKFPFPALRKELAGASAQADPATPLAWRAPIPLFSIARIEVASEEHKTRLLALTARLGNVSLPAAGIAVAGGAIATAADRPASTSQLPVLKLPERLNAIQGALAMAASTLPGEEGWTQVLQHVLDRHPSRPISDPANINRHWFALPWIPRGDEPAQPVAADWRRLWNAAMSCLRWPAAQGLSPAALAEKIAGAASRGAPNPAAARWLAQTREVVCANETIDTSASFDERAGLAIQLALLRPDPDKFRNWTADMPDLPSSVAWAGAALCGWRHGYRNLDNAFRGDAALQETVANAALAAAVPAAYAPTWTHQQENPAAVPDTWQHIKMGYASLYRASGDRVHRLPCQEGFGEFRDLVAGAVDDAGCPPELKRRLKALHRTLETQHQRHDTVLDACSRLDGACARLADLKEKMDAEPGHTIETMPGYTAWLRDRDAAVAHWRKLAEDPALKEYIQIAVPDMMAPQIAEISNEPLTGIHRTSADYPAPSSGHGVYTPSLQPLSRIYDRALAFVDRDPNLLPYAPQFDRLKTAVSTALDECRHAPDLLDMLTTLRTTLDAGHERMTRARTAAEDVASASRHLCSLKAWAEHAGRPIHEAPRFKTWRSRADRVLRDYEAAEKDPALAPHLARADSLGVLTETAVPMLRDPRFREPAAAEASLAVSRQRPEQGEEHYSMSA